MKVEQIQAQQAAFRAHQRSIEELNQLSEAFSAAGASIKSQFVAAFAARGLQIEVSDRSPTHWHFNVPPAAGGVSINIFSDLTFDKQKLRSEFIDPRTGHPKRFVLPPVPMALPIEILASSEHGGSPWHFDLWWAGSGDNTRLAAVAVEALLHNRGPRELKFEQETDLLNSCFVATELFGEASQEVAALRRWRDRRLSQSAAGRTFVASYYRFGPVCATAVRRSSTLRWVARRSVLALCKRLLEE